jgi:hypothetical protein
MFNILLPAKIKIALQSAVYLKYKATVDSIFAVCSLVAVPTLVISTIAWSVQPASNVRVSAPHTSWVNLEQGSSTKLEPKISMRVSGPKVIYNLQLMDMAGNLAYRYPQTVVDKDDLKLDTVNVKLPDTIIPGEYSLVAYVRYLGNPIQTNSVQFDLAHISVGTKTN